MIYKNLHAIIATRLDGLIGDGDKIPWHHSADLKHFKEVTKDASLIMGVKTLVGIAKNYFKEGKEVLPGRRIYVSFGQRGYPPDATYRLEDNLKAIGNFNWSNVFFLAESTDVVHDLSCVMANEGTRNVFIAGGAKTYDRYIAHANDVYLTLIRQDEQPDYHNPVYLSRVLQHTLFNNPYGYEMNVLKEPQTLNGVTAEFMKISRLKADFSLGDGFSEF